MTRLRELLDRRYAWRAFSPEPVPEDQLRAILEAGQLSASCMNNQPWRFLVLTEPDAIAKGRQCLTDGNYWAKTAPVLIFGSSKEDLDCMNPDGRRYFLFDLGMAAQNIILQATEFDLVARPMAGFFPARVRETFSIPDDYTILVAIAIGRKGPLDNLKETHRQRSTAPRSRNPLEQNFFLNSFNPE